MSPFEDGIIQIGALHLSANSKGGIQLEILSSFPENHQSVLNCQIVKKTSEMLN